MRAPTTGILIAILATACGTAGASVTAQAPGSTTPPVAQETSMAPPSPSAEPSLAPPPEPASDGHITVVLREYAIDVSAPGSLVSSITADVDDTGAMSHEIVALRTDLAGGDLPLDAKGNVDEGASDVEVVAKLEKVPYGSSATWSADLPPGRYVFVCNLPAHYRRGMWAEFTVAG